MTPQGTCIIVCDHCGHQMTKVEWTKPGETKYATCENCGVAEAGIRNVYPDLDEQPKPAPPRKKAFRQLYERR
jgi:DNA replicative helicase MCM subunit Mcm2 (Cdc46/Mcm family)